MEIMNILLYEEMIFTVIVSRTPSKEKIESSFVNGIDLLIANRTPPDLLEGPSFRKIWKSFKKNILSGESQVSDNARMSN